MTTLLRPNTLEDVASPDSTLVGIDGILCTSTTKSLCRGKSASSNTYGAGAPSRFGGERRMHEERIEATHTHKDFTQLRDARMRKTLLLLVWIDSSSCSGAQEATVSLELDVDESLLAVPPPFSTSHGPPFICSRGYPQAATQARAKRGKD